MSVRTLSAFTTKASVAAAVAVVALLMAPAAQAVVVHSGIVNLSAPANADGLYQNFINASAYAGSGFPTVTGPGANYDLNL